MIGDKGDFKGGDDESGGGVAIDDVESGGDFIGVFVPGVAFVGGGREKLDLGKDGLGALGLIGSEGDGEALASPVLDCGGEDGGLALVVVDRGGPDFKFFRVLDPVGHGVHGCEAEEGGGVGGVIGRAKEIVGGGGENFSSGVAVLEGFGEFFGLPCGSGFKVEGFIEDEQSVLSEIIDGAGPLGLDEGAVEIEAVEVGLVDESRPVLIDEFDESLGGFFGEGGGFDFSGAGEEVIEVEFGRWKDGFSADADGESGGEFG